MASLTCWLALALVLLVDGSSARHTFLAVSSGPSGARIRKNTNTDNNIQDKKPNIRVLHVDSVIKYRFANTVIFSKLLNRNNRSQEISFTTVLPDSAFISGFAITINDNVYKAYVKEKEEAKIIYQKAVQSGTTAGHVEQSARDSNQFTISVNVEAFGKVSFNLTYEELLSRELGRYKHKINLNPEQLVNDMLVQVTIVDAYDITKLQVPQLRESNEIILEDSSEDKLAVIVRPNATSAIIRWSPTIRQQREFSKKVVHGLLEVLYDVDRSSRNSDLLVYEGYFVHFLAPESKAPLPKHVVFALDCSGSMEGHKMQQLKEAMNSILDELRNVDTFSLLHFSEGQRVWATENRFQDAGGRYGDLSPLVIIEATKENIDEAKGAVNRIPASGGTHIYDALNVALDLVKMGRNTDDSNAHRREPMIIFLTDGQPNGPNSDIDTIISHTTAKNTNPPAVIYSLGFGNDADMNFLKKLSNQNFGFARKIYEASDASIQLQHFFRQVASPQLSNVSFHFLEDQVDMSSLTKTQFHVHNSGSETVVAGRLNGVDDLAVEVTGQGATGDVSIVPVPSIIDWDYLPRPPLMQNASSACFMERMWAYLTIRQLLDIKDSVANETLKTRALELALQYSFVTPLTSLVVVKPNETTISDTEDIQPSFEAPGLSYPGAYDAQAPGLSYPGEDDAPTVRFDSSMSAYRAILYEPEDLPIMLKSPDVIYELDSPPNVEHNTEPSSPTVTTISDVGSTPEFSTTTEIDISDVEYSTEPSSMTVTTISDVDHSTESSTASVRTTRVRKRRTKTPRPQIYIGSTPELSTTTEIDISDIGSTPELSTTTEIDISDVDHNTESSTTSVRTTLDVDSTPELSTTTEIDISDVEHVTESSTTFMTTISDVENTTESMTNTVGAITGVDNAAESWTNPVSDISDIDVSPELSPTTSASPLAKFSWFSYFSNKTHITLLIDGVYETFQIGYSEPDKAYSTCMLPQNVQGHCRHLPHCALDTFAQHIGTFLHYYFCRIDNFIGACCPDNHVTPEKNDHPFHSQK